MKTYVLTLSKKFMASHPKAGQETHFAQAFAAGQLCAKSNRELNSDCEECFKKIHTLRKNYDLWEKRIKEIQTGKAILSVRQWSGKPYCSKQIELARLTAKDGVGIQKACFLHPYDCSSIYVSGKPQAGKDIAKNDGLSFSDWVAWFSSSQKKLEPLAIIHFTKFRY